MKYIKMKIREHFLPLIREGKKKHEYRLAAPKFDNIHVGDILILCSTQNKQDYVKVVVDSIKKMRNWNEALDNYWDEDFKDLYHNKEEVLKECYRFYTKEEVDTYGINVYDIRLWKPIYKKARYLMDTNIIIERESFNNNSSEVALTYAAIDNLEGKKFVHNITKEELKSYKDENVRNSMMIKLKSYNDLISKNEKTEEFEKVCNNFSSDENSKNDNELLLQAYNGNVDFFITSDNAILKKAKELYIDDIVLNPNELLCKLEKSDPSLIKYDVLSIELVKIGTIDVNDAFFDTLREDYGGSDFNRWFQKKSEEKAYIFKKDNGLQGFLYLKTESEDEVYNHFEPIFKPAKRLKVGTFKISQRGLRIGERFLKIIFDNALKREVDEIYVTMFEDKREEVKALKNMMEEWGFKKVAINKKNGEIVLAKEMKKYNYFESPKYNYPLIKENKHYMFFPIMAKYHTQLFPDLLMRDESMSFFDEKACQYAIEKIYVCGWDKVNATPGDLVCIYRMSDFNRRYRSVVSGIAILQEVQYPKTLEEFLNECKNKSVFSEDELNSFYKSGKYRTIIKVLYLYGYDKKINLNNLYNYGIIRRDGNGPRINSFISKNQFDRLDKLGKE